MYDEHDFDIRSYRAPLNPEFVRAVKEKRRQQELEDIKTNAQRSAALRAEMRRKLKEAVAKARDDREAARIEAAARKLEGKVPVSEIIAHVAASHYLHPAELTGEGRTRQVFTARVEAILAVRDLRPELSSTQIGRAFNRDHTSILHVLQKYGQKERAA